MKVSWQFTYPVNLTKLSNLLQSPSRPVLTAVKTGLEGDWSKLDSFVKLTGYVNCQDTFTDQPKIINGASDMLVEIFGDQGRHSRVAVGSNALPLGIAVEIDAIVQLK